MIRIDPDAKPLVVDPHREPGIWATVSELREWLQRGLRGDLKVYVRENEVKPVGDIHNTVDLVQKHLGAVT